MKYRVILLIILIILRCILGWINTVPFNPGEEIRIKGNIINIFQNSTYCIYKIGNFLIETKNICAAKQGDKITVVGTLEKTVIDSLDGNLWLRDAKLEKIVTKSPAGKFTSDVSELADNFRNFLVDRINKFVPNPEAGLVSGMVLGYKKDIGQKYYDAMVESGTIHIAVASGYNILLVGGSLLSWCFYLFRRSMATWIAIGGMGFYVLLAGGDPPVVRAFFMAVLLFLGRALGRSSASLWALTLSAWFMVMLQPSILASISFQLSVAASVGLLALEPRLSRCVAGFLGVRGETWLANTGALSTLSTMVSTLPILWWYFGRLSLIGILSNSLILPFVPLLMLLGVGVLILPSAFWVPTYVLAHWMAEVIRFFGS